MAYSYTAREKSKRQLEIQNYERFKRNRQFKKVIADFRRMGFGVDEFEPFKFRIQDCIEITPATKEFYDIRKDIRGKITGVSFDVFLKEFFNLNY